MDDPGKKIINGLNFNRLNEVSLSLAPNEGNILSAVKCHQIRDSTIDYVNTVDTSNIVNIFT